MVIDAKKKKVNLEQFLGTQDVTVDLSIPGWWPALTLELQTAWIGNWHSGDLFECANCTAKAVDVTLQNNKADFDALTNHIAKRTLGRNLRQTRITRVIPPALTRCRAEETVLVYGTDVWRSSQVFVDGVPAIPGSISVLPDMEGIAARFDMSKLRHRSSKNPDSRLVLWTRDGHRDFPIQVSGSYAGGACTDASPPATAIASVAPDVISRCADSVTFAIQVNGQVPKNKVTFAGASKRAKVVPCGQAHCMTADFTIDPKSLMGLDRAQLTVVGDKEC